MSLLFAWLPSLGYPSSTVFSSINPTHLPKLLHQLEAAQIHVATATAHSDVLQLSRIIRGCEASLTVISAEEAIRTATVEAELALATQAWYEASYNLKRLEREHNVYNGELSAGGNYFYTVLFALLMLFNIGMMYKLRFWWYNVTFVIGFLLQFLGYLARVLSLHRLWDIDLYLMQFVCLTISPVFLMAGLYFFLGQLIVMHGRHYSRVKPMTYAYIFVVCDVVSLIIQAAGGGIASSAVQQHELSTSGRWIMFGGVLFQVVAMTVFLVLLFFFLWKLWFQDLGKEAPAKIGKPSILSYLKMLLCTPSSVEYRRTVLERFYDTRFSELRNRKLMPFFPLIVVFAVIVIYIRCIYRVVELQQGFTGFLMTHDPFIMTLDAMLITLCGLVFIPFHPVFVFGSSADLGAKSLRVEEHTFEEDGTGQLKEYTHEESSV